MKPFCSFLIFSAFIQTDNELRYLVDGVSVPISEVSIGFVRSIYLSINDIWSGLGHCSSWGFFWAHAIILIKTHLPSPSKPTNSALIATGLLTDTQACKYRLNQTRSCISFCFILDDTHIHDVSKSESYFFLSCLSYNERQFSVANSPWLALKKYLCTVTFSLTRVLLCYVFF